MWAACGVAQRAARATQRRVLLIAAFAGVATAGLALADTKPAMKKLTAGPFTLTTTKIESFGRGGLASATGKLTWRGGLVLQANHKNFGGWSGLAMDRDGRRFIAVSDAGAWMTGEITYSGKAPSGITNARMGPLLAQNGHNLAKNRDRDAEAVAVISGSAANAAVYVAFEQNARIARYDFSAQGGASATRGFLELPEGARGMRRNGGFEAMTVMKGGPFAGAVIAFSERQRDEDGNRAGWMWTAGKVLSVKLKDQGDYDVSDVASLEDGSIIVLERRFRWLEGMNIRLRLIRAADVGASRAVEGETLLEADLASEIDNMEGLSLSRDADGTAVLTLISDDNFNRSLQRTLLLQFAYPGDPASAKGAPKTAKARP